MHGDKKQFDVLTRLILGLHLGRRCTSHIQLQKRINRCVIADCKPQRSSYYSKDLLSAKKIQFSVHVTIKN